MATAISETIDELPVREDGRPFPYTFVTPAGAAVFADTLTEIVAELIEGYGLLPNPDGDSDPAFEARLDSLSVLAGQSQAVTVAAAREADDTLVLEEDELTALLSSKDTVLIFDEWDCPVPLILQATNYAPFTEHARPAGENIVWVNGYTESDYLHSLTTLGVGELHVHDSSDGDTGER